MNIALSGCNFNENCIAKIEIIKKKIAYHYNFMNICNIN